MPVTAIGRRGCSGGGHTGAASRSTRNAEINPANSIVSPAIRNIVASRALSRMGRRGSGPRSSPPSSPVLGGGAGMRPFGRREAGGRAGGASRTLVIIVTIACRSRSSRSRAPPRCSRGSGASGGSSSRAPRGPSSYLVERQQRQHYRQVEQRGEEHAAGGERGRPARVLHTEPDERETAHQRADEVDRAGQTDQRRQQAHR